MQTLLRLGEEEERENDGRKQEVTRVSMKGEEKRNRKFTWLPQGPDLEAGGGGANPSPLLP